MLALASFVAIINYKRKQETYLREKIQREEEFNKQLLRSQIEVQESTFAALSKELHDNIGQLLSTAKLLLGISERSILQPPDTFFTAGETVGKAIIELRALSKSLSKEWLEQFDLIQNLETEVTRINSTKILQIIFEHPNKLDLDSDKQIMLFRILQEAIQNVIKHSNATRIDINIIQTKVELEATIQDNGNGFDIKKMSEGLGINNMKQRTKLLNGIITWLSSDSGSQVIVKLNI